MRLRDVMVGMHVRESDMGSLGVVRMIDHNTDMVWVEFPPIKGKTQIVDFDAEDIEPEAGE